MGSFYITRDCPDCGETFTRCFPALRCMKCSFEGRMHPAHGAVARAVARGALPPARTLKCVDCGKQARDYDHRDYAKPLDVQPVCRSCNILRGPAKGATNIRQRDYSAARARRDAAIADNTNKAA